MDKVLSILEILERKLHKFEIRTNKLDVEKLLDKSFIEIGYSWKTFDYKSIIDDLDNESKPDYELWSGDYKAFEISDGVFLLTYNSGRSNSRGELSRLAKRSSIWKCVWDNYKMVFHQATPVDSFD